MSTGADFFFQLLIHKAYAAFGFLTLLHFLLHLPQQGIHFADQFIQFRAAQALIHPLGKALRPSADPG